MTRRDDPEKERIPIRLVDEEDEAPLPIRAVEEEVPIQVVEEPERIPIRVVEDPPPETEEEPVPVAEAGAAPVEPEELDPDQAKLAKNLRQEAMKEFFRLLKEKEQEEG